MTPEIIHSIVQSYKDKGLDTHILLKDPLFLSLPLDKQIEAIQAYAGVLAMGSKAPSLPRVLTKAIVSGASAGFFASLPFMGRVKTPAAAGALAIGGAVVGGIIGVASGTLAHKSEKQRHETTNKYLIHLANKPDIPNAVKVLDVNRKFEPITLRSLINRAASPETSLIEKAVGFAEGNRRIQDAINIAESGQ